MEFKASSIKRRQRQRVSGFTMMEFLVGMGVTGFLVSAIAVFSYHSTFNLLTMYNYAEMDSQCRKALDLATRDIRSANKVISCTTNVLTLQDYDGTNVVYTFATNSLVRTKSGAATTLLTGCDSLSFQMEQKNPAGAFETYPSATATNAKIVSMSWKLTREIFGQKKNSESVSSAKVVIRRQQ